MFSSVPMLSATTSAHSEPSFSEDEAGTHTPPLPSLLSNILGNHGQSLNDLEVLDSDFNDEGGSLSEASDLNQDSNHTLVPSALPTDDIEHSWTSPITGTREERTAKSRAKGARYRREAKEKALHRKLQEKVEEVLCLMKAQDIRLGQFLTFVFNPTNKNGKLCYNQFFQFPIEMTQVLDFWLASSAGPELEAWAADHIAEILAKEAKAVTASKILQTQDKIVDDNMVQSFNLSSLRGKLNSLAPVGLQMLTAMSTSPRAHSEHKERRKARRELIVSSTLLTCLGEYSRSNNLAKRMTGLYLFSTGAQRQTITVLSTLGLSESYTNIVTKNLRRDGKKTLEYVGQTESEGQASGPNFILLDRRRSIYTGTLCQLSESMLNMARSIASTGLCFTVYDNINMMFRRAEQVVGRHDSQENGTCATLVPLFKAKPEDLKICAFQDQYLRAPKLKLSDILHTPEEANSFNELLTFTILRIIVNHGGTDFVRFRADLEKNQPCTPEKIALHKTTIHPLETWPINESTILGNIAVEEAIRTTLLQNDTDNPGCSERLRFHAGDQLSLARFRAIENIRAGQETGFNSFFGSTWIPGLFHAKMADMLGLLQTHWGKPNTGTRNPGSLWFHNTRLGRLPITLSSPPSYRVSRDLVYVSLYARVLHCLLLVSNTGSLEQYSAKFKTWKELVNHAKLILERYTQGSTVLELRESRGNQTGKDSMNGDMIFENAILFLRDALISREFTDAVKAGDSGRVLLVLKVWALGFRGCGRTKYAHEMLHIIHHLTNILTPEIRTIILNNWLVNPTGNPNSWVEVDLLQEHLNYWIKTFYKAHGSNASWEWLTLISPCVDMLRQLARNFHQMLGADQGTRHAPPQLSKDIESLMNSLSEHKVYEMQKGRTLDDDDPPVKDIISVGFHSLTSGTKSPLNEYNEAFVKLQRRRRMNPVQRDSNSIPEQEVDNHEKPDELTSSNPTSVTNTPIESDISAPCAQEVDDVNDVEMEEPVGELDQMMEDLEQGKVDSLFPVEAEEDVALDMDTVAVGDASDDDSMYTSDED
ncbi:hypothetical protein CPC08DRAFT_776651 [Agrocybe pediades]|nr:hypothetical protein CPC08DRAFT_776651 [Agrocybe pediades]